MLPVPHVGAWASFLQDSQPTPLIVSWVIDTFTILVPMTARFRIRSYAPGRVGGLCR